MANMKDIVDNRIGEEEVREFMERNGIMLFEETSAKTGENVYEAFRRLGEKLLEKNKIIRDSAKKKGERVMVRLEVGDPE